MGATSAAPLAVASLGWDARHDDALVSAVDLVRLGLDGAEPAFRLEGGDVLALDRLR